MTLDIYCKPESPVASCSVYLTCYRGRHPSHSQSSPLCDKSDCAAGDVSVHGVAAAVARLHLARFLEHCSSIYIYLFIYLYLFISSVIYLLSGPRDTPWCFYPDGGGGGGDCGSYNWAADGPGFTDQFYEVTRNYLSLHVT